VQKGKRPASGASMEFSQGVSLQRTIFVLLLAAPKLAQHGLDRARHSLALAARHGEAAKGSTHSTPSTHSAHSTQSTHSTHTTHVVGRESVTRNSVPRWMSQGLRWHAGRLRACLGGGVPPEGCGGHELKGGLEDQADGDAAHPRLEPLALHHQQGAPGDKGHQRARGTMNQGAAWDKGATGDALGAGHTCLGRSHLPAKRA